MYNLYLSNAAIIFYYTSSHKVMTCTTYIYLSQSALYQSCNIVYLVVIVIYIRCVHILHSVTIVSYTLCDNYAKYLLAIMNNTYFVKIMQYSLYLYFISYPELIMHNFACVAIMYYSPVYCLITSYSNLIVHCKKGYRVSRPLTVCQ
jgi:hypothetical protein